MRRALRNQMLSFVSAKSICYGKGQLELLRTRDVNDLFAYLFSDISEGGTYPSSYGCKPKYSDASKIRKYIKDFVLLVSLWDERKLAAGDWFNPSRNFINFVYSSAFQVILSSYLYNFQYGSS